MAGPQGRKQLTLGGLLGIWFGRAPPPLIPDLRDWVEVGIPYVQNHCLEKFVALPQDSAQSRGREGFLFPLSQVG